MEFPITFLSCNIACNMCCFCFMSYDKLSLTILCHPVYCCCRQGASLLNSGWYTICILTAHFCLQKDYFRIMQLHAVLELLRWKFEKKSEFDMTGHTCDNTQNDWIWICPKFNVESFRRQSLMWSQYFLMMWMEMQFCITSWLFKKVH